MPAAQAGFGPPPGFAMPAAQAGFGPPPGFAMPAAMGAPGPGPHTGQLSAQAIAAQALAGQDGYAEPPVMPGPPQMRRRQQPMGPGQPVSGQPMGPGQPMPGSPMDPGMDQAAEENPPVRGRRRRHLRSVA
jgi:hypothetical protein